MKNSVENTPAHCHGCHQFDDCHQAQNMGADTIPLVGYVCQYAIYCLDCTSSTNLIYCGESDSPTHCEGCGVPIIHDLTPEGVEYVREHLTEGGGCCRELWPTVWGIEPRIPVDSIVIPGEYVALCEGWHGGLDCMLYAVSSTGGLTTGTHRSRGCDTDEQWYYSIWLELSSDVGVAVRAAKKGCNADDDGGDGEGHDADYPVLVEFEEWVDEQCERLCESYGLEDWERDD